MNNKKSFIIICVVFVLLIGAAYLLYGKLSSMIDTDSLSVSMPQESSSKAEEQTPKDENAPLEDSEPEKISAPDFTVYDADGNAVQLTDYVGKPIVLNFWASWCGPCKMEMPDFNEKYLEKGDEINFLMVNMTTGRETKEKAAELIKEKGYSFPVFYDTDEDAAMTYGVYSLPTTFFIDDEGYAVAQATGAIDGETLQRGIDMISGKSQD